LPNEVVGNTIPCIVKLANEAPGFVPFVVPFLGDGAAEAGGGGGGDVQQKMKFGPIKNGCVRFNKKLNVIRRTNWIWAPWTPYGPMGPMGRMGPIWPIEPMGLKPAHGGRPFSVFFGFCFIWALGGFSIGEKDGGRLTKILPAKQTYFWEFLGQPFGENTFPKSDPSPPPQTKQKKQSII